MRAKRAKPGAVPRLEPLENRLAPAATLTPLPDNPDLFTLQIDLSQHPHGGDGLPDTVYVSRAGGRSRWCWSAATRRCCSTAPPTAWPGSSCSARPTSSTSWWPTTPARRSRSPPAPTTCWCS
ncbi:MAG: hypothetical protein U0797_04720 [Gemmataceae bacterium]